MVAAELGLVLMATALATAVAGGIVAGTAYRGYRRHDSQAMRFLAIGIALITVSPVVLSYGLAPVFDLSQPVTLLAILLANIAGLLSILYSLEGT